MCMATSWGTQESGGGVLHGEAQSGRGDTGKSPSVAADEGGARGRHGASSAQRGQKGGQ